MCHFQRGLTEIKFSFSSLRMNSIQSNYCVRYSDTDLQLKPLTLWPFISQSLGENQSLDFLWSRVSWVCGTNFKRPELLSQRVCCCVGGWCTVGFGLGLCFFCRVTQPFRFPGCSRADEGQLGGAMLGRSAPPTGGRITTAANEFDSMVHGCNSSELKLALML